MNVMLWLSLALSLFIGGLLGVFFFGGLWWTVQRISDSSSPYLVLVASFAVRMAVIMAGFYLLLAWGWQHMLIALAGLLIARTFLAYRAKPGA